MNFLIAYRTNTEKGVYLKEVDDLLRESLLKFEDLTKVHKVVFSDINGSTKGAIDKQCALSLGFKSLPDITLKARGRNELESLKRVLIKMKYLRASSIV